MVAGFGVWGKLLASVVSCGFGIIWSFCYLVTLIVYAGGLA